MSTGYLYDVWTTTTNSLVKISNDVKTVITLDSTPGAVCVDKNNVVWATCYSLNKLYRVASGASVATEIPLSISPNYMCVDKDNAIWARSTGAVVKIVDGVVVLTIPVSTDEGMQAMCCDKDNAIWIACFTTNRVMKIVNGVISAYITGVGVNPIGICCDINNVIYVTALSSGAVYKIVNNVVTGAVSVGSSPYYICIDKLNALWAPLQAGTTVKKVVSGAVASTVTVGSGPAVVSVDKNNALWVVNNTDGTVSKVVDGANVLTVSIGTNPWGRGDATGMQAAMLFGWDTPTVVSFFQAMTGGM